MTDAFVSDAIRYVENGLGGGAWLLARKADKKVDKKVDEIADRIPPTIPRRPSP
jgi:hypothetical protein